MKLYIAFDDTDNLYTPGTGHVLEDFRTLTEKRNWGATQRITRHQLFFHPDVPYTSHNSAMCFIVETEKELLPEIEAEAVSFLKSRMSEGSDPGLCLLSEDELKDPGKLMVYGRKAKTEILSKELAYETAACCGARLSEHGGTGDGIIGALAGAALRLEGSDGRFRGRMEGLPEGCSLTASELVSHPEIDRLALLEPCEELGSITYPEALPGRIMLRDRPKTINLEGRSVFLISPLNGNSENPEIRYINWTRQELKRF